MWGDARPDPYWSTPMRAEAEKLAESIRQSLALLRRHL
jgi:hypothetical protein